jgi:IS30 family transposase
MKHENEIYIYLQLSRNLVRKFPRTRYVVNIIDSLLEMADVSNIRSSNQNYKYLLFVIDVFSRYLWIQLITEKTSKSVINALKVVLRSRKLNSIKSDKGSEFKNKEVRSFLKKEDIHTNL